MQRGKMRNEGEKQQGAESETPAKGHVDMAGVLWGVSLDPAALLLLLGTDTWAAMQSQLELYKQRHPGKSD